MTAYRTLLFFYIVLVFGAVIAQPVYAQYTNYDSLVAHLDKKISDSVYSLMDKSQDYQSRGELDSAVLVNKKILDLVPNCAPILTTIAGLYGHSERFRDEIMWAQRSVAADPEYLNGYLILGNGYAALKLYDSSNQAYIGGALADPHSPMPVYSIGINLEEQGFYKEALKNYLQATVVDTSFEAAYYNAGLMYVNLKQNKEALKLFYKSAKLNPYDYDAGKMIKELESKDGGK